MAWRVESGSPSGAQPDSRWSTPQANTALVAPTVRSPAPFASWERIYHADPMALPTQSTAWCKAIVSNGHFVDESRLYTFRDGGQVVVPLFAEAGLGRLLGRLWSPPAAWGFGGTIADHRLDSERMALVLDDLSRLSPLGIRLRPNPLAAEIWDLAAPNWTKLARMAHVLDLSGGMDVVWASRIKPRTRTTIRKAEASGMEIVSGNSRDLIAQFYGLFQRSIARWAQQQHEPLALALWRAKRRDPIEKFYAMADAMGDKFCLWIARHEGEAIAAIVVLQDHNAHYTRGAMNEELAGPLSANFLLHHRAIEAACTAGCRSYHMGETGNSASLAQFKSRFGAVGIPYGEYLRETVPLHRLVTGTRGLVKRAIGFRDA